MIYSHKYSLGKIYLEKNMQNISPDPIVEKNRQLLLERSVVGLQKYGVTVNDNRLTQKQWLQHALEEALDLANYLQKLITDIEKEEERV